MAFTTNVQIFRNLANGHSLLTSYRLLAAVELALKDANCTVAGGGHDVPGMLDVAASRPAAQPFVPGQLISFAGQLRSSLGLLKCQGKNGNPQPVPAHSYPYMRYCRFDGDWGGVDETPPAYVTALEQVCQNLCAFLSVHGPKLGVNL